MVRDKWGALWTAQLSKQVVNAEVFSGEKIIQITTVTTSSQNEHLHSLWPTLI
jgi:hypothetical protein